MSTFIDTNTIKYTLTDNNSEIQLKGTFRTLQLGERQGLNPTSIHSRIQVSDHTMNAPAGTMELWFFPLEDLSPSYKADHMAMNNPFHSIYPLISDCENPNDMAEAAFAVMYEKRWHPQFYAKMYKGGLHFRLEPPIKAFVSSEHMDFRKNQWYQVVLTWDENRNRYRLYVNGILVGTESQFDGDLHKDLCGERLYTGNPGLCYSEINFYDREMKPNTIQSLYKANPSSDLNSADHLAHIFAGKDRKQLEWTPGDDWVEKLSLSLKDQEHMASFHVQGYTDAPSITEDGMLIETPKVRQHASTLEKQVYVWSKDTFEGDLYVTYEFKALRPGGLSLLMTNAGGMNREDFLKDYPLRTNGSMVTVYGEDVRNYHWEYYREMNDVRNDVASSGLTKNPYLLPLGYGCMDKPLERDQWHKLQYLQRGGHIIGAIDGVIMFDVEDNRASNSGDYYDFGHIAIRCMVHTKLLVRNLKVMNRRTDYKVIE